MEVKFAIVSHASKEWAEAVRLREDILRKPLGSFFTDKELEEEKSHIQIIGSIDSIIIATAVLVPEKHELKMQRVAVSDQCRNLNIGSKMMDFCETYAKNNAFKTMYCHARDSAVRFYQKNEYSARGDYFDEDGIPHLKMEKML